jgi:hypothetical protein
MYSRDGDLQPENQQTVHRHGWPHMVLDRVGLVEGRRLGRELR